MGVSAAHLGFTRSVFAAGWLRWWVFGGGGTWVLFSGAGAAVSIGFNAADWYPAQSLCLIVG